MTYTRLSQVLDEIDGGCKWINIGNKSAWCIEDMSKLISLGCKVSPQQGIVFAPVDLFCGIADSGSKLLINNNNNNKLCIQFGIDTHQLNRYIAPDEIDDYEYENYNSRRITKMMEFVAATTKQIEEMKYTLDHYTNTTNMVIADIKKQIDAIKFIREPSNEDVDLINKRIDIIANKLQLLANETGKTDLIKELLNNVFPSEAR